MADHERRLSFQWIGRLGHPGRDVLIGERAELLGHCGRIFRIGASEKVHNSTENALCVLGQHERLD